MRSVVFIGAGNVSFSLAFAFKNAGWDIAQIYSRTISNAENLASSVGSSAISKLSNININADLYIIAVPDSAIQSIVDELTEIKGIIVHTSGSTTLSVLSKVKSNGYGVLYPFQTFSRNKLIDLKSVPVFVEANSPKTLDYLMQIGAELSNSVSELNSEKRLLLHIGGVFACNFTNHILALTYKLANEHGIDFKLLQPLVDETVSKAFIANPKDVQTGPAVRNDINTTEKHSEILRQFDEQLHRIYNELSLSIQKLNKL